MPSFPNRVRKRSTFSAKRRAYRRFGRWAENGFAPLHIAQASVFGSRPYRSDLRGFSISKPTRRVRLRAVGCVLKGDFRDDEFVRSLPHCPTVFYLVGTKFGTSNNPQLLREINVEVARELAYHYRSSKIVALSTGCVYSSFRPNQRIDRRFSYESNWRIRTVVFGAGRAAKRF